MLMLTGSGARAVVSGRTHLWTMTAGLKRLTAFTLKGDISKPLNEEFAAQYAQAH